MRLILSYSINNWKHNIILCDIHFVNDLQCNVEWVWAAAAAAAAAIGENDTVHNGIKCDDCKLILLCSHKKSVDSPNANVDIVFVSLFFILNYTVSGFFYIMS